MSREGPEEDAGRSGGAGTDVVAEARARYRQNLHHGDVGDPSMEEVEHHWGHQESIRRRVVGRRRSNM
jgi:hypothetical protein